jgi:hypothetical protein
LVRNERALEFGAVHSRTDHALLVHRRMNNPLQNSRLKIGDVVFPPATQSHDRHTAPWPPCNFARQSRPWHRLEFRLVIRL